MNSAMGEFQNTIEISNELHALNLIIERQEWRCEYDLQNRVVQQIRSSDFDPHILTRWATEFIRNMSMATSQERRNEEGLDIGAGNLGPSIIIQASEPKEKRNLGQAVCGKRVAPTLLEKSGKGLEIYETKESGPDITHNTSEDKENSDTQEITSSCQSTPIREPNISVSSQQGETSHRGRRTPRNRERWSWKKAARSAERRSERFMQGPKEQQNIINGGGRILLGSERRARACPPSPQNS